MCLPIMMYSSKGVKFMWSIFSANVVVSLMKSGEMYSFWENRALMTILRVLKDLLSIYMQIALFI